MKKKYPKGPFTSKHPKWLKMMKKIESRLWLAMSQEKRQDFITRADQINKGEQSQEAKAQYVNLIVIMILFTYSGSIDTPMLIFTSACRKFSTISGSFSTLELLQYACDLVQTGRSWLPCEYSGHHDFIIMEDADTIQTRRQSWSEVHQEYSQRFLVQMDTTELHAIPEGPTVCR